MLVASQTAHKFTSNKWYSQDQLKDTGIIIDNQQKGTMLFSSKITEDETRTYEKNGETKNFKIKNPTYLYCEASENFKDYSYFFDWCKTQKGFLQNGFELDKDLLIKGNKVYNENVCVFLPQEINSLLVKSTASRGEYLIGVCWHKRDKVFMATVSKNKGKQEYLGYFKTELEAFNAYKTAKESFVKEQANKWKGKIDDRAYEALMSYTVEITD